MVCFFVSCFLALGFLAEMQPAGFTQFVSSNAYNIVVVTGAVYSCSTPDPLRSSLSVQLFSKKGEWNPTRAATRLGPTKLRVAR